MTQRYDLTDLRLFLHVADASNITHGALRANMTLASASERIRAMELDLGTSLLVRKRRGVELTPAGTALLHHARIVTQQLEHMRGELNDYAKGLRAQVHVRSNTMGISTFLPARLARFLSAHPNIDVDLEEVQETAGRVVDDVIDRLRITARAADLTKTEQVVKTIVTGTHRSDGFVTAFGQ